MPLSSQSSSSSKSSINSSNSPVQNEAVVGENINHKANLLLKSNLKKETIGGNAKTMQASMSGSSFRRNSDTILMNQYLKLPMNSHHANKKVNGRT